MAKYGEGDKRWIVQDRPDGTNVHNWHWAETDCLEWSRTKLSDSLSNLTILSGEGNLFVKITKLDKLEGEAYVNIRKGKIIPGYELALTLSWEGEAKDDSGICLSKSIGKIEIPYISDENADEDPEVRVSFDDDGVVGRRIKEAFIAKGKPVVLEKVREYVESMARGGPCKEELEVKKVAPKAGAGEGFRTVKLSERFRCRAVDLYEILMDENRWKGFTQSNAKISREVGGEFSIFDGSVTGSNVELKEGKLIVQKWRFGNWPDGVFSTVKLTFEEPESGVTVVKLVQTDVPEEDRYGNETVVENTERGWRDLIFQRIRAIFGFGL
uniref:Activator of Hsp90 ATPase AHSA1-like N-terminal domain-containing protein n=1 Tax=Chenopodium quinoa TaxID=63459 RepID=A0A803LM32_CHEQI